jgi:hypothetical protein
LPNQSCSHRIVFDIVPDPVELRLVPHQVVVAFVLPKGSSGQCQDGVGPPGRDVFQRFGYAGYRDKGSGQQMNVIWHDYEGVQKIVPEDVGVVPDGFDDHVRDERLAQVKGSNAGFVKQSILDGKGLSRVERGYRKCPVKRKAVLQSLREKDGMSGLVDVRKPPPVERHNRVVP